MVNQREEDRARPFDFLSIPAHPKEATARKTDGHLCVS